MLTQRDPVVEFYEAVQKTPSIFGRLISIADCWNPQTGRYERGLPDSHRNEEMDKALARWHHAFFVEWLSSSLAEKERDVVIYWANADSVRKQGKKLREVGEAAIPPLVRSEERALFLQDLAFIQALL